MPRTNFFVLGYLPQAPSMFKTLSGSSLPSINNLPPEAQLER